MKIYRVILQNGDYKQFLGEHQLPQIMLRDRYRERQPRRRKGCLLRSS